MLKVPHHGAATSIPEFFEAVRAQVAVVSVGQNTYGHPVPSTLAALAATGARVWRTDQRGTVTVTFGGVSGSSPAGGSIATVTADGRLPSRCCGARTSSCCAKRRSTLLGRAASHRGGRRGVAGRRAAGSGDPVAVRRAAGAARHRRASLPKEAIAELAAYLAAPDPDATADASAARSPNGARCPRRSASSSRPSARSRGRRSSARTSSRGSLSVRSATGVDLARRRAPERSSRRSARSRVSWRPRCEQLATAFPGQRITPQIVAQQFRGLGEQQVWDLCDKAFGKDLPGAIRSLALDRGRGRRRPDDAGGIASRVRDLIKVRALPDRHAARRRLPRPAGLRFEWQARRYQQQARNFSMRQLVDLHERITEADRALKSGATGDVVMPVADRGDRARRPRAADEALLPAAGVRGLGEAGLVAGRGALVDDALAGGLVEGARGLARPAVAASASPLDDGRVDLLGGGLERRCGRPCSARAASRSACSA